MNLSKNTKLTMVKVAQGSAGSAIDSDSVDMSGWEGVIFFGTLTTYDAGNSANLAQCMDDSTFLDLEDTANTPGDSGDSFEIDLYKPVDQYIRCEIDRSGASTATGDIYALQYGARKAPTSQGATVDLELHVSPDEGTA